MATDPLPESARLTEADREVLLHWCWEQTSGDTVHESLCEEVEQILAARLAKVRACPTCNGWNPVSGVQRRETVGLICPACGWDYGENGGPTRVITPERNGNG